MLVKYIILIAYFLILFLIGLIASRQIKGVSDYYVGGKRLGYWVVAFSARATGESAWLLLGLTGLGAMVGVSAYWVVLGEVLGVAVAWFLMAKPFKRLSDSYDSVTIPDYLVSHFQPKNHLLRIISASTLAIFVIIYVSSQIDSTGKAFEYFLDWDYFVGALVGFFIVVTYIFTGGFVAVAWSDLFQGLLMFGGLILLPIVAFMALDSSAPMFTQLGNIDPDLLNIWGAGGLTALNMATLLGYAMIGLGFMGSPQVFVRFMSIKNNEEINKGRWVAIIFTLLTDAGAVTIGILGRILFTQSGDNPIGVLGQSGENVLPMLVESVLPLLLSGFYIAIVLSAIMSTIDSLLVVASSAVTRDFYQQILRPDLKDKSLTTFSRVVTLAMALLALGLAMTVAVLSPSRSVFWFSIFGWSGIAATFCPTIILSLFWKKFSASGAVAAMISGFLCVPLFKFYFANPAFFPNYAIYFDKLDVMFPSFVIGMLVGVLVSLWKPRKL